MEPHDAVDLGRQAIETCLLIGGPLLIVGLVVGLVIGALQSMTGIHDQTVSFVPKVLVLIFVIAVALPWFSDRLLQYTRESIAQPVLQVNEVSTDPRYD